MIRICLLFTLGFLLLACTQTANWTVYYNSEPGTNGFLAIYVANGKAYMGGEITVINSCGIDGKDTCRAAFQGPATLTSDSFSYTETATGCTVTVQQLSAIVRVTDTAGCRDGVATFAGTFPRHSDILDQMRESVEIENRM